MLILFQQDGATGQAANEAINLLKETFGGMPSKNVRFNATGLYFVWDYVMSLAKPDRSETTDPLKECIRLDNLPAYGPRVWNLFESYNKAKLWAINLNYIRFISKKNTLFIETPETF